MYVLPFHFHHKKSGFDMHILAVFSFVAVIVPMATLAIYQGRTILAQSAATPLEFITMPIVMVGGTVMLSVSFAWLVFKERSKYVNRIDSLERSRRSTNKLLTLIADKLEIPSRDVMAAMAENESDDAE